MDGWMDGWKDRDLFVLPAKHDRHIGSMTQSASVSSSVSSPSSTASHLFPINNV